MVCVTAKANKSGSTVVVTRDSGAMARLTGSENCTTQTAISMKVNGLTTKRMETVPTLTPTEPSTWARGATINSTDLV